MSEFVKFHPAEVEIPVSNRPLGELSDFVVRGLPTTLNRVRNGRTPVSDLVGQATALVQGLDARLVSDLLTRRGQRLGFATYSPYNHEQDLAALDLKMLQAGVVHSNQEGESPLDAPTELTDLVDRFATATDQPPVLTYEDLIYINPPGDPRLFTDGDVGRAEHAFYFGHRKIEEKFKFTGHIETAIERLQDRVEGREPPVGYDHGRVFRALTAEENLDAVLTGFPDVMQNLKQVGLDMSPGDFGVFRKYLGSIRGLKGPSGAFTALIPVIEILLAGEKLEPDHYKYLSDNNMYFPRKGRKDIVHARNLAVNGLSLTALAEKLGNPPELSNRIQMISDFIREFRGVHYKAVKHQVPGAITGDVQGTGGEDNAGVFLRGRMKIRHTNGGKDGK